MDWSFCIIYQAGQDLRAKWTDGRLYDATVLYMHQGKEAITCILPVGFIARIILVMWDEDFIGLANAYWSYFNLFVVVINIYQLMAFAFNLNDEGHATWPKPLQTNFCLSLCFLCCKLKYDWKTRVFSDTKWALKNMNVRRRFADSIISSKNRSKTGSKRPIFELMML